MPPCGTQHAAARALCGLIVCDRCCVFAVQEESDDDDGDAGGEARGVKRSRDEAELAG